MKRHLTPMEYETKSTFHWAGGAPIAGSMLAAVVAVLRDVRQIISFVVVFILVIIGDVRAESAIPFCYA